MLNNIPSQKMLEKFNFKREGIMRGYRQIRGVQEDIVLYSLIRPEFEDSTEQ
jgi:RimJ/RimL family protein N-acetyltransferase